MKTHVILSGILLMILNACTTDPKSGTPEEGDFSNTLTAEEIQNGRFTPELLWKLGRVADVQLSPDGQNVLYALTRYDSKTDKKHTWIYTVSASGGEPENLTGDFPSCSNGRWVDNKTIAFLSKDKEKMQIWVMDADGSNKRAISKTGENINGFEFAPNGQRLFYLQDVKLDSTTQDLYPDLPSAKGMIIEDLMYRHWDSWQDYSFSHIFIADYKSGKITSGKDIMPGEHYDAPLPPFFDNAEIAWNHDGSLLAYTSKKLTGKAFAESTNSDIYLYTLSTGETRNITEGMNGYDRYPVFSSDGSRLAFMSMETPGYEADKERLFIYDLASGTTKYLTDKFDQNSAHFSWSNDDKKIVFISGIKGTYQVFEIHTETGEIRQITEGIHDYNALAFKNNVMVGIRMSMTFPSEIYRIEPQTGKQEQLTFTNKNVFKVIKTAIVQEKWITTTDNKQMLVWLVLPPDFDSSKKYPALLYCQGGPQSAVSQFFSYRWNLQLMASNGYIVIAPNRRGLPTFGQEWNAQISGDYGGQNIRDYLSAADAFIKEPYIDSERMGAVGASYGGYSVLYLAGHHNKRFKAFIAHCGMFNLESQSAGTEEMFFVHHDLGGYYWDHPKPKSFTEFSPHLFVDKWDTPIMLITGMNDFRIPYTESLQAFNVAQLRGIPSKLLLFPDENHWVTKPQNSILWQREFFGWLDKWLKPDSKSAN